MAHSCPAEAIFADDEVPADQQHFLEINARLAPKWPVLTVKKAAPADAEQWDGVRDKLTLLEADGA